MGGDHAIVTELGEKQIELAVPGPPALDRAISGILATARAVAMTHSVLGVPIPNRSAAMQFFV